MVFIHSVLSARTGVVVSIDFQEQLLLKISPPIYKSQKKGRNVTGKMQCVSFFPKTLNADCFRTVQDCSQLFRMFHIVSMSSFACAKQQLLLAVFNGSIRLNCFIDIFPIHLSGGKKGRKCYRQSKNMSFFYFPFE